MSASSVGDPRSSIAVIGMAGRFPGASDLGQFWRNLSQGVESVTFFSDRELLAAGVPRRELGRPNHVRAAAVLEDVELFDAGLFGYTRREAESLDPQHRVFLECAWTALEDAGYSRDQLDLSVGVCACSSWNRDARSASSATIHSLDQFEALIGADKDFLPTTVSYRLNLTGPSFAVQCGCSSSLVAICVASQLLASYQCDLVLAGGVSITLPQNVGYLYQPGGIASPDGHCRAFDAAAQGTIKGNGVGVVVLRRLADALADRDSIRAVIRGTAVNNDGHLKVGYTAPAVRGQAEVIGEAIGVADIGAETIAYIEAHGTGTPLGDPIEIAALTEAFRRHTGATRCCAVGSVKTNIGHLDVAAGVAGFIKAVLAIDHGQIPPSPNFERANPQCRFEGSPFHVNRSLLDWPADVLARRAGVSSFGIGGTNAHVILEESPTIATDAAAPARDVQLILLSARSEPALTAASENLAAHLRDHPDLDLADVAYTYQVGRRLFDHRRAVVCRDIGTAVEILRSANPARSLTAVAQSRDKPVIFAFPGQGAQRAGMAASLYGHEPAFREAFDHCVNLLEPALIGDLRAACFDDFAGGPDGAPLDQTWLAQPALFALEYALAKLWMSWGVQPCGMIGHSLGEYVAGCLAGTFSVEDALALVVARGRLMQDLPPGGMLAAEVGPHQVAPLLGPDLDLAAINGSAQCVLAGPLPALEGLERVLTAGGIACHRLRVSRAFHSAMMEPAAVALEPHLRRLRLAPPRIPFISSSSGRWISDEAAIDPSYWTRQLRATVRFHEGLMTAIGDRRAVLLEVGPGSALTHLARQAGVPLAVASLGGGRRAQDDDMLSMGEALARLWLAGTPVDWERYHRNRRRRLSLPTYPFQRELYAWRSPARSEATRPLDDASDPDAPRPHLALPGWKRAAPPSPRERIDGPERYLLFSDGVGLADELARRLLQRGHQVICVRAGRRFGQRGSGDYVVDPRRPEHYRALTRSLRERHQLPDRIVHGWTLRPRSAPSSLELFRSEQVLGFYSLVHLAQAAAALGRAVEIVAVTTGAHDVGLDPHLRPERATVLGPLRVIPQEHPQLSCRQVDVVLPGADSRSVGQSVERLLGELEAARREPVVAYRGVDRWVQTLEKVASVARAPARSFLRQHGVYLITGGLGQLGLTIGEHLARTVQARLVLVGRSGLPARSRWNAWLDGHSEDDPTSIRIRGVRRLEAAGASVLLARANVASRDQMRRVLLRAQAELGPINGVVHAAGSTTGSLRTVQELSHADHRSSFEAKVYGLYVLDELLRDQELDFALLMSSLSSLVGGVRLTAYAAANAFMDAFARARGHRDGPPWTSVNWDGWRLGDDASQSTLAGQERLLDRQSGLAALAAILALGPVTQVAVSGLPIELSNDPDLIPPAAREATATTNAAGAGSRPLLLETYVAPRDELEQAISQIWVDLLGVEPIGAHDDFFELGGHSLLGIRLLSRLADVFGVELPLRSLFDGPTVAELAAAMARQQSGRADEPVDDPSGLAPRPESTTGDG